MGYRSFVAYTPFAAFSERTSFRMRSFNILQLTCRRGQRGRGMTLTGLSQKKKEASL